MQTLEKRMIDYFESIIGNAPTLRDAPGAAQSRLPLFLRERYQLHEVCLWGSDCLLALETPDWETGSPSEYAGHAEALRKQFSKPVTLVVPQVASYARNRMVRAGIPFIVPGSQLFMPFMMVDLRERFSSPETVAGLPITPAAQCILLYHLLRQPLQEMPLRDIAKLTGYSAMMVTRVKDEWETNGLCQIARVGRSVVVEFPTPARKLWHMAEQLLSSPVKKSNWVRWKDWEKFEPPGLAAGYTALAMTAMTEDDALPTWALPHRAYREMLNNGIFHTVSGPEDANLRVEAWKYDPRYLSDGSCVDPLSLVLSLRGDSDDRVQQQLQSVLDGAFSNKP